MLNISIGAAFLLLWTEENGSFFIFCSNKNPSNIINKHDDQCRRPTLAMNDYRMEPEVFLLAAPSHSWSGCNMHSRSAGSCSTCKNRSTEPPCQADIKVTLTSNTSILPRCAMPCPADCRSVWKALEHWSDMPPPSHSLIRDKDQFGGETLVAWEHLWTAAVFCWVSTTGMCPRRIV